MQHLSQGEQLREYSQPCTRTLGRAALGLAHERNCHSRPRPSESATGFTRRQVRPPGKVSCRPRHRGVRLSFSEIERILGSHCGIRLADIPHGGRTTVPTPTHAPGWESVGKRQASILWRDK